MKITDLNGVQDLLDNGYECAEHPKEYEGSSVTTFLHFVSEEFIYNDIRVKKNILISIPFSSDENGNLIYSSPELDVWISSVENNELMNFVVSLDIYDIEYINKILKHLMELDYVPIFDQN